MAEQQLKQSFQDKESTDNTPISFESEQSFAPNVAEIVGYDKDMFRNVSAGNIVQTINPTEIISDIDNTVIDWKGKNAVSNLNSIVKQEDEKVSFDVDGNFDFSSKSQNDVAIMMTNEFSDPDMESERKSMIQEMSQKMQEEVNSLTVEADNKIAAGELKENRRQKYIDKRTKEIENRYREESGNKYLEIYDKGKNGRGKSAREIRRMLRRYERDIKYLYKKSESLGAGDPKKLQDIINANTDPEYQTKYEEIKKRGVNTIAQFEYEYLSNSGKVKDGDVFLAYTVSGRVANDPFGDYSRPVYFQAISDENGNKKISAVRPAYVHPITNQIIGAYEPRKYEAQVPIVAGWAQVAGKDEFYKGVERDVSAGIYDQATADKKIKEFEQTRAEYVKKNLESYNRILSSNKYSMDVKIAVIASVFPNEFQEKYTELVESGTKRVSKEIVSWAIGFPAKISGITAGGLATGIDEITQYMLGRDDVEFPMGVLPLAIESNPELATTIDDVIAKAGKRSSIYTSSIQGYSELVNTADIILKNKDINLNTRLASNLLGELNSLITDFNTTRLYTEAGINNYSNGLLDIYNKTGYLTAINKANELNNNLLNDKDEDVRNAYRFIRLKQQLLNYDGSQTEALKTLSEEDINFINTVGLDLTKNKIPLLNKVVERINEVATAYNKATELYPAKMVADYESRNKKNIDNLILSFQEKQNLLLNSSVFTASSGQALDLVQNMYDQYDKGYGYSNSYYFPLLTRMGYKPAVSSLAITNPGLAVGIGLMNGISRILRGVESTANIANENVTLNSDYNTVYVSSSLNEYKRFYESEMPETGIYYIDIAKKIGGALPQMAAFAGSFIAGGPAGGAAYLTATMSGEKYEEAANAGLQPIEQMLFAGLSIGIELGSEMIGGEAALIGMRGSKSILTPNLLRKIMNVSTRKEALKEYAGLIWNTSKNLVKKGVLESFEDEVSDKANYILQNMYNNVFATSFEPNAMTFKESIEGILVNTAVTGIFKGGTALMNKKKSPETQLQKELKEGGIPQGMATMIAASSTPSGVNTMIKFINQVESGEINADMLDMDMYNTLKNKIIPNAMSLQTEIMRMSSNQNLSVQQRSVAVYNLMQVNEITAMIERGEISASNAETVIEDLNKKAQKALEDKEFADEQYGMDDTGLVQTLKGYFNISDISVNEQGILDARIKQTEAAPVAPVETAMGGEEITTPTALEQKIAENESDAKEAAATSTTTNAAPAQNISESTASTVASETATTPDTGIRVEEQAFEILDRNTFADRLIELTAAPLRRTKSRASKEIAIRKNPEKAISIEIFNTRAMLDIAVDKYQQAVQSGRLAPNELAEARILEDKLNKLNALKNNYIKTKEYATEISEELRQASLEQSDILQYQGAQEGQLEEGERERREREASQSTANYRNSNFSSQAQSASQEIAALPVSTVDFSALQPGQEVQFMDQMASMVSIDEGAAIMQMGQPVVDRVKQYMAETNFTSDLPVVRDMAIRMAEQKVIESEQAAGVAVNRLNQSVSKSHKKSVNQLVDRIKQAFPSVQVFMDKNGFESAIQDQAARNLMTKGGVVYGRVMGGNIYLNPDFLNYNTPIHEFGHLWLNIARNAFPNVYNRGIELIRDSEYMSRLEQDPLYANLTKEELEEEALVSAIGDKGEQFVYESQRNGFKKWLKKLIRKIAQYAGIFKLTDNELNALDLDMYLNMSLASIFGGQQITAAPAVEGAVEGAMMAAQGTFLDKKNQIINEITSRGAAVVPRLDYLLTVASGMFEHLGMYDRNQAIEKIRLSYPELNVEELEQLARQNHPYAFPSEGGFMAKMKNEDRMALVNLAQQYFERSIKKGRDYESARREALSELNDFAIKNLTGKTTLDDLRISMQEIIDEVSANEKQRIIDERRTQRLNQLFKFPQVQDIATAANQEADRLSQEKVKASDAIERVTKTVKDKIEDLYSKNKAPENVSWINMMSLAPSIAADAVMAAYPSANRSSLVNEDRVIMTTTQFIRNAVSNQIRAIKAVEKKSEAIRAAVKEVFKQMSDAYGTNVELSIQKVNKILAEMESAVFNRADVMQSEQEIASVVSDIIESSYRNKLADESVSLIEKLNQRTGKTKYGTDVILNKVMQITSIDVGSWKSSNATLEDIASFNIAVNNVLAGNFDKLDYAIQKASDIVVDNKTKVRDEYISLMDKMARMIKKAGALDISDYASLVSFKNAMDDVEDRKGDMAIFTSEQMSKIQQRYSEVLLSLPDNKNIDVILKELENDIRTSLLNKATSLNDEITSETSDIRTKVKNPILYHQLINLSKFIKDYDYLESLSTKDKLALINTIDNVMNFGLYTFDTYNQYIKAKKYQLRKQMMDWAIGLAKNRNKLASKGLVGTVINKFRNFYRTFTDVEGSIPTPQLIANNFELLRLHSMDVELFSGFDQFDMGLLEREIFAPMASGVDGAVNKTQAKLGNLQNAMIQFADKSNHSVVKRAIANVMREYNVSANITFKRLYDGLKNGSISNVYAEISSRMATIIAHQIDHISNLEEGQVDDDMILKRNILENVEESKKEGMTMFSRYGSIGGMGVLTANIDNLYDAIAYAALTDNGKSTLAGLKQEDLLDKLTESQKKGLKSWREFIEGNRNLVEASMMIKGNMKAFIKNYFPRRVMQLNNLGKELDYETYLNSQFENIGLSDAQIRERTGNVGKLDLNGNRVLLNNLKSLHLLNEMKPYVDYIKAVNEVVVELNTMAGQEGISEEDKRNLNFASAYAQAIEITIKSRLDNSLLNGDKALNDNFSLFFRLVSKSQKFAANMWLISTFRQLGSDYPSNIVKSAAAMAYANKTAKSQFWRLFSPSKSAVKTEKGKFVWEDYVKIAELTGSPVYRTVSIYSDNFLYDYSKTPEQLQRKQRIVSWQDMAVKKQVWMERFESAFKKITGEAFDHKAFEDERGAYRAMFLDAVERASSAADSTVDRQFGLPSFARQPMRANVFLPFIGRPLRNFLKAFPSMNKYFSVSKTSQVSIITGFMMGYPSIQYSLFRNYIKLAFSSTSGLSIKDRGKYMSQALTEAYLPAFIYGVTRAFYSALFITAGSAIYSASEDEEEQNKLFKEMEDNEWWENALKKFKLEMDNSEDKIVDNLINNFITSIVDPQSTILLRTAFGVALFHFWKKDAVNAIAKGEIEFDIEIDGKTTTSKRKMSKEERYQIGRRIKAIENNWKVYGGVKPIAIYPGEEYLESAKRLEWVSGKATEGYEELFELIGGFGEVVKTARSLSTTYDLWRALETNENLKESDLYLATLLKGYGLIFGNIILGGKYGWTASLLSGDATRLSNTLIKDMEKQNDMYEKKMKKSQKSTIGAPVEMGVGGTIGAPAMKPKGAGMGAPAKRRR